ncbi:MAG TPA: LptA/OstA family protein, partial [Candidatus Sulfotelmatobacter sp.]
GRADLHDVNVILYGRDTSRFDQIYGDDFTYDPKSGDVTAKGDVQIDLQANPAGGTAPDQAIPKQLKDPIHLKTRDLVFNRNSGDAYTEARVDFSTPQATGWALGIHYSAKPGQLTLVSQVHVTLTGENDAKLFAAHGVVTRDPRVIILDHPRMERDTGTLQSDEATFFLGPENEVQRVEATGNVNAETSDQAAEKMRARADKADLLLASKQNLLRTATLTGKVHIEREGDQPMQGDAGRVVLDFLGQNVLQKARASEEVRIAQRTIPPKKPSSGNSTPQDFDITASAIDFFVAEGRRLDRAQTSGAAQITIFPAPKENQNSTTPAPRTVVTADRFDAKFVATDRGATRLASVHGAPNAKIVSLSPSEPDRISTSQTLDATFLPEGGISNIIQQGRVTYTDGQPPEKRTEAAAEKAVYTPSDQILQLTGSPRISNGGMVTTATNFRINRASNDVLAEGYVKSTYNEVKDQPNGALLASSSPIHVTSAKMTAHNSPAIALYEGNARLWQDANIIEAPSIQFDRDTRSLVAQGTQTQPVSTVLVQQKLNFEDVTAQKPANAEQSSHKSKRKRQEDLTQASPITITALRLTYSDPNRKAHYSDGVNARGTDFDAHADEMDVYLLPRSQSSSPQNSSAKSPGTPGKLDRMVAEGNVILQEPGRRAKGQNLIYTASEDKFVLTGGPPSIFDAEHGKITGDSLTFFRSDDRVLVEGKLSTPVVTQTRVKK